MLRLGKPSLRNTKLLYLVIIMTYYTKCQASANLPCMSYFDTLLIIIKIEIIITPSTNLFYIFYY